MANRIRGFAKLGAVLAISSIALVGCTGAEQAEETTSPVATEQPTAEAKAASTESAANFANEFFATLLAGDSTDYSKLTPPVELTDEQAQQLMLDGKVDGVSDKDLGKLVDFLYENNPLGDLVYFDADATVLERLQVISALILAQDYANSLSEEQTPEKLKPEDVTLDESGDETLARFSAGGSALAPTLIFVKDEWKIEGKDLLESFGGSPAEETAEPAPEAPAEEVAPAPSE